MTFLFWSKRGPSFLQSRIQLRIESDDSDSGSTTNVSSSEDSVHTACNTACSWLLPLAFVMIAVAPPLLLSCYANVCMVHQTCMVEKDTTL